MGWASIFTGSSHINLDYSLPTKIHYYKINGITIFGAILQNNDKFLLKIYKGDTYEIKILDL